MDEKEHPLAEPARKDFGFDPNERARIDRERWSALIVRLLRGMGVLVVGLLLILLLGRDGSVGSSILTVLLLIVFLFYIGYTIWDWRRLNATQHRMQKIKTIHHRYTMDGSPAPVSYVRVPASPIRQVRTASKPRTEKIICQAHWASFVHHAFLSFAMALIVLVLLGMSVSGLSLLSSAGMKLLLLVMLLFFCGSLLYHWADWQNDVFIIEADRISDICKKPFAAESIKVAMMGKIQSIQIRKHGLAQILFNYGTLIVTVGEATLDFPYISEPERIQKLILQRMDQLQQGEMDFSTRQNQAFLNDLVQMLRK